MAKSFVVIKGGVAKAPDAVVFDWDDFFSEGLSGKIYLLQTLVHDAEEGLLLVNQDKYNKLNQELDEFAEHVVEILS